MGKRPEGQATQKSFLRHIQYLFNRNRLGELLVIKGLITPQQLRFALQTQKATGQPLGQVFISHKMVSSGQLRLILGSQSCLRIVTSMLLFSCVLMNTQRRAMADSIKDVPAQVTMASAAGVSYAKLSAYPALFGMDEKRSQNLSPFVKWTGMFKRFDQELQKPQNAAAIKDWIGSLGDVSRLDLDTIVNKVNTLANEKRYILDDRNWGSSDYWATPIEFIKRGGDCEDFAIAKYTALRMLGVPEERLRVAIVHDNEKNIPHAILIVYTDTGVYFLDNQIKQVVNAGKQGRYRAIFSINRDAWWLHTAPNAPVLASAE